MVAGHLQIKKAIITPFPVGTTAKRDKQNGFPLDFPKKEISEKHKWNSRKSEANLLFPLRRMI